MTLETGKIGNRSEILEFLEVQLGLLSLTAGREVLSLVNRAQWQMLMMN